MQIRLKNIGIVRDSMIKLDGLTIITGKNNSGKTTVGKTIYSLFDAVANIQRKAENDKLIYIMRHLYNLDETLEFLRYCRASFRGDNAGIFAPYPALKKVVNREFRREGSLEAMEKFLYDLIDELKTLDVLPFVEQVKASKSSRIYGVKASDIQSNGINVLFNRQKEQSIVLLEKIAADIHKDPDLIDYARESINQTLRMKAIESYITLEKKIFQGCRPFDQAFRLQFCVVIDEDSVDGMEETLAELSGRSETTGNPYASIKASLKRYINCRDCSGTPYFYDEVKVLSVTDFENYLRLKYEK